MNTDMCMKIALVLFSVTKVSSSLWKECNSEASDPPQKCFDCPNRSTANKMAEMKMADLVKINGYPVEAHRVSTKDGYILTLFRIPYGKTNDGGSVNMTTRTPVLMASSLFASSTSYCLGSIETIQAMPFALRLADEGFDVWLSNIRGSPYSLEHVYKDTDSKEFWDFNLQETGSLDHSAEIDHILQHSSGHDDLIYFGYSRGSSEYLILLSDRPEYNAKIRAGFLVSPVALNMQCFDKDGVNNCHGFELESVLEKKEALLKQGKYFCSMSDLAPFQLAGKLYDKFCNIGLSVTNNICLFIILLLFPDIDDDSADKINPNMVPVYVNNLSDRTSLDSLEHFFQQTENQDTFTRFDYGPEKNQKVYGQPTPGIYNLSLIKVPTAIYIGDSDPGSNPVGAKMLRDQMVNVTRIKVYKNWTHPRFCFPPLAYNAYSDIIKAIKDI